MRLSLAQICSGKNISANLKKVREVVERAAEAGAELVVFPEAASQGFGTGRLDHNAAGLEGEFCQALAELANTHEIAIVAGTFMPADQVQHGEKTINRIDNVSIVALPGRELQVYKKIHTYDAFGYRESDTVRPGSELLTFEYGGLTFGVATCYDVRFPQQFRRLARQGAQVILLSASWAAGADKLRQWRLLTSARALDSTSVLVAVGQATPEDDRSEHAPSGIGRSAVIGPTGKQCVELGEEEELATFDLAQLLGGEVAEVIEKTRAQLPVLDYEE